MGRKFTPGPWGFLMEKDGDEETGGYGVDVWHGEIVALPLREDDEPEEICKCWPRDEANGNLIAAAPDLYAACLYAKDVIGCGANEYLPEVLDAIVTALKKARGEV